MSVSNQELPEAGSNRRNAVSDPYEMTDDAIQTPPVGVGRSLRHIGPGLILAGSIVGTGELIATTNLGARVGFSLLWLVIVSCFIKVFVQIELGRYAISSGETTMMSFRRLPGPGMVIGWWWIVMMLVTQLQLGAMIGGIGHACHMAVPQISEAMGRMPGGGAWVSARPEIPWAFLVTLVAIALLARGSYKIVERVTTTLVVVFTLMTVLCVALLPASGHPIDWSAVRQGLTFGLPAGAIGVALAMFGITGVGASELVMYPYWCIEKGYARKTGRRLGAAGESDGWLARARGWVRVMYVDAWVSFGVYTLATLAFFFLGAAVLYHRGAGGQGLPSTVGAMLDTLSEMYRPVLGQSGALWFIVIGAFAVLSSTLFAATAANARALTDFLHVNRFIAIDPRKGNRVRWIRLFCVIFPVIDLALFLWMGNPLLMVVIAGIAQAMTLPMLATAAVYLRYQRTDARLAPGKAWDLFLWLSLTGLTLASVVGLWDAIKKVV